MAIYEIPVVIDVTIESYEDGSHRVLGLDLSAMDLGSDCAAFELTDEYGSDGTWHSIGGMCEQQLEHLLMAADTEAHRAIDALASLRQIAARLKSMSDPLGAAIDELVGQ